jgi:hypothetical protein
MTVHFVTQNANRPLAYDRFMVQKASHYYHQHLCLNLLSIEGRDIAESRPGQIMGGSCSFIRSYYGQLMKNKGQKKKLERVARAQFEESIVCMRENR